MLKKNIIGWIPLTLTSLNKNHLDQVFLHGLTRVFDVLVNLNHPPPLEILCPTRPKCEIEWGGEGGFKRRRYQKFVHS